MESLWAPWRMEYIKGESPKECIFCLKSKPEEDRQRMVLFRGEHSFVIINRYPYTNGHLMVAPYRHTVNLGDFTDAELIEVHRLISLSCDVLKDCVNPDGFNVGLNIGRVAGAGIDDHLHYHIVPRWSGDTNFMPVMADVRVVPQHLEETYEQLRAAFDKFRNRA
ncbi:HIT family protein [Geoalkalibacter subterraneus]|jgi:ATP adenylyltransferase|uniref:HIT family hydrolase n=1 Tax=Geoalkalibacter subterraneus TaxID=483547 RepID=A0A0B5FQD5_9BACT|nr:HIT domain-containing protein [Geoalkalibacter subterraneus]AJF06310.1 HIT family hydrolase [Geoalkalibacter subterraneus]